MHQLHLTEPQLSQVAKMEDVPIRRGTVDLPDDEIIIYECGELASIEGSG